MPRYAKFHVLISVGDVPRERIRERDGWKDEGEGKSGLILTVTLTLTAVLNQA